ncbi:hypothetical protein J2X65_005331 [Ancylobacter sp. 3268]|nr:hypothetical protein [Ancylobacter sp. 3268]MDR6955944.1 hypothetical protein [Ancylobacter sp. 3268]
MASSTPSALGLGEIAPELEEKQVLTAYERDIEAYARIDLGARMRGIWK